MIKTQRLFIIGVLLLTGCATPSRQLPPPVEDRGVSAPAEPATLPPAEPRPAPRYAPPVVSDRPSAVTTLVARADEEITAGRLDTASSMLERALRISRQDADLWYRLAELRFRQGDYSQAVQLARKANDYAQGDRAQLRRNWQLLVQIHAARGDEMSLIDAQQHLRDLR